MRLLTPMLTLFLLVPACGGDDGGTTSETGTSGTSSDGTGSTSTSSTSGGSTSGGSSSGGATDSAGSTGGSSGGGSTTGNTTPCGDATDRPACEAMNTEPNNPVCGWIDIVPVDDNCGFGSGTSECVQLITLGPCPDPNTCGGGVGDELWWRDGANGKELFQQTFCDAGQDEQFAPVGWTACKWDQGAGKDSVDPAACACAC